MEVFVQPDRQDRERIAVEGDVAEIKEKIQARTRPLRKGRMGGLFVAFDTEIRPVDKIIRERIDKMLTEKAELRQNECWEDGCSRRPTVWVREIRFDVGEGSDPQHKGAIDSSHYPGPVPGFCFGHMYETPAKLAQAVYFDLDPIVWGFRPTRFFVLFTDGSMVGGDCIQLNPHPERGPTIVDRHDVTGRLHERKVTVRSQSVEQRVVHESIFGGKHGRQA